MVNQADSVTDAGHHYEQLKLPFDPATASLRAGAQAISGGPSDGTISLVGAPRYVQYRCLNGHEWTLDTLTRKDWNSPVNLCHYDDAFCPRCLHDFFQRRGSIPKVEVVKKWS